MATFQKRSGNWRAIITKRGFPRQSRTFDTKAEAEAWAATVESEIVRGVFISMKEAENTPLSEALDRYEREIVSGKKGAIQERSRIRIWKNSTLANKSLAAIQGKDIAAYRDSRLTEVGPNTVRLELALLSHLFTIAVKEWSMGGLVNPVQQVRKPKAPEGRHRRLKPEELDRILSATESPTLPDLARFAVETAARQEEIADMIWDLVDLKKRTITLVDTKNGDTRVTPLSSEAVRILERIPRRIDGKVWGITPHAISVAWRRAVFRARAAYEKESEEKGTKPDPAFLVDLTFHDLRHEATSRLFEKGLNPMQVAAITGHKTLQMLKRYTHLKAEDLAELLK